MTELAPLSLDFASRFPDSFARVLARGDADESAALIERLPNDRKAAIVARLPTTRILRLLDSGNHRAEEWLTQAPFDDAVLLLSRIPRDRRLALVNALTDRRRQRRLLRHQHYPEHTVGTLVQDSPMRITAETPAAEILAELREHADEDPGGLAVVDGAGRYAGVLDRWKLLVSDPPAGAAGDYAVPLAPLHPETPIADVADNAQWNERNWLPVVDHRQRVMGRVSRAAVLEAAGGARSQRPGHVLLDLLGDLVFVFASVLEKGLAPRKHA